MKPQYVFRIAGLLFRIESARELQIPDCFQPFQVDSILASSPDIIIEIVFGLFHDDLVEMPVMKYPCTGEDIVRLGPIGEKAFYRLYIPPGFADIFCRQGKWLNYLPIERMFLPYNRIILHAAAVEYEGKAYLFSAPSGVGKSTHADLWQRHYGARILNGDKTVIHVCEEGFIAYGSPIAGSSGIYCCESAPIAAIFLLQRGSCNRIDSVSARGALLWLYSESVKCSHDSLFNARLLDLIDVLRRHTRVLTLKCLPEKSAVDCVLQYLKS